MLHILGRVPLDADATVEEVGPEVMPPGKLADRYTSSPERLHSGQRFQDRLARLGLQ
jgi:hypothetical protein